MMTNQNENQQQPSPPPPPSSSPRYLLAIPKFVASLKDLEIEFVPFHESRSNSSRSIGAKISKLNTKGCNRNHSRNTIQTWINQYNMKVGDVIYKVNEDVVKTRSFSSIIERLESLFFNRSRYSSGEDPTCMISLVMERKDGERILERSTTATVEVEPLSLSMDLSRETNVLHSIFSSKNRNRASQNDGKDGNDSDSLDSFRLNSSKSSTTSNSSGVVSPFGAVLGQNNQFKEQVNVMEDTGYEDYSLTNDSIDYNLSAIPEGAESDTSRESGVVGTTFQPPPQCYQHTEQENHQQYIPSSSSIKSSVNANHDHILSQQLSTVYRPQHHSYPHDLSSSSFSYSDSECLQSPVSTSIATDTGQNKSIKTIEKEHQQQLRKDTSNSYQENSRNSNRGEDMNFAGSAYMSPESDNYFDRDSSVRSWGKSKSVQFLPTTMQSNEISHTRNSTSYDRNIINRDIKLRASDFQSPISDIHPSSSIESCSVSTVYFSPLTSAPKATTPTQVFKNAKTSQQENQSGSSSLNDIPIHMLDYNFVRQCTSPEELKKIARALEPTKLGESQKYPSLLRLVKMKLEENVYNNNGGMIREENKRIETYRGQKEQVIGSSDIPSHIHVKIGSKVEDNFEHFDNKNSTNSKSVTMDSAHEYNYDGEVIENLNSIVIAHAELQDKMNEVLNDRDVMQQTLSCEIVKLKSTIDELEIQKQGQNIESRNKIECLMQAKSTVEERVKTLQETLVSSSKEARQVMNRLKEYEAEVQKLQLEVKFERESKSVEMEKASSFQTQLEGKILNLSRQLDMYKEDSQVCRELIEMELRSEYHATSQIDRARISELERCLSHTREELKSLYRENEEISEELAKIAQDSSTPAQYKGLLKEFTAVESCANALAKALAESESELDAMTAANKMLERKNQKILKRNYDLELGNEELILSIENINEELKNSHEVIANLNKELDSYRAKENDYDVLKVKWVEAKRVYQTRIADLKSKLTHTGEMISVDKYQKAIESALSLKCSLKDKEAEIEALRQKISQLEARIEKPSNEPVFSPALIKRSKDRNVTKHSSPFDEKTQGKSWQNIFSPPTASTSPCYTEVLSKKKSQKNEQNFFSPSSVKRNKSRSNSSGSKLKKPLKESGKKSKNGSRVRSALTPIDVNYVNRVSLC